MGDWESALGFPEPPSHSGLTPPPALDCVPRGQCLGARARGCLLVMVTPGLSSAGLGTGQRSSGLSGRRSEWPSGDGELGTQCARGRGEGGAASSSLGLASPSSHPSLSCSTSSPPSGPETAASSSSSASGRTRYLKRWACGVLGTGLGAGLGATMESGVPGLGGLDGGPLQLLSMGTRPNAPVASSIGSSARPCPQETRPHGPLVTTCRSEML